jgi:hypothetical protein
VRDIASLLRIIIRCEISHRPLFAFDFYTWLPRRHLRQICAPSTQNAIRPGNPGFSKPGDAQNETSSSPENVKATSTSPAFALGVVLIIAALAMLLLLIWDVCAIAHSAPATATEPRHWSKWYKQSQMNYMPEQPARIDTVTGEFQSMSAWYLQHVSGKEVPGGMGTMTAAQAQAEMNAELVRDFGSLDSYEKSPAQDYFHDRLRRGIPP